MSDLRWILLLAGVLFLIGLTAWESRRSRLARAAARDRARSLSQTIPFEQLDGTDAGSSAQTPAEGAVLPAWLEGHAMSAGPALGELPDATVADFPLDASEPEEQAIRAERHTTLRIEELPSVTLEDTASDSKVLSATVAEPPADEHGHAPAHAPVNEEVADASALAPAAELPAESEGVSVEWPPEEQRRIVSVRIVSSDHRLSGRATRQALAACGFVHGRYRIFHQPDDQGHALVSCASLNKPGMFDPSSMDYQRYSGLSLFTVLPGPLSPPEAVDRLLITALDLSARLDARLQDDAGHALDEARIAELRMHYRELDAMAGPPA